MFTSHVRLSRVFTHIVFISSFVLVLDSIPVDVASVAMGHSLVLHFFAASPGWCRPDKTASRPTHLVRKPVQDRYVFEVSGPTSFLRCRNGM
jgi:hypothetical protein